jgi:hypothetical protein
MVLMLYMCRIFRRPHSCHHSVSRRRCPPRVLRCHERPRRRPPRLPQQLFRHHRLRVLSRRQPSHQCPALRNLCGRVHRPLWHLPRQLPATCRGQVVILTSVSGMKILRTATTAIQTHLRLLRAPCVPEPPVRGPCIARQPWCNSSSDRRRRPRPLPPCLHRRVRRRHCAGALSMTLRLVPIVKFAWCLEGPGTEHFLGVALSGQLATARADHTTWVGDDCELSRSGDVTVRLGNSPVINLEWQMH